jgi:hypothetical protein
MSECVLAEDTHGLSAPSNIFSPEMISKLLARKPLSVSIVLDCTGSMGSEIEAVKEGTMAMVDTLSKAIAPVKFINIVGYWDPESSPTDPEPRSTGFLNLSAPDSRATLAAFVHDQLPCEGGGDVPEDVPAALRHLLVDIKAAGFNASNKGDLSQVVVHITDAGFRTSENERMKLLTQELQRLGVLYCLAPVRGAEQCRELQLIRDAFAPAGQYMLLRTPSHGRGLNRLGSLARQLVCGIGKALRPPPQNPGVRDLISQVEAKQATPGSNISAVLLDRTLARLRNENGRWAANRL